MVQVKVTYSIRVVLFLIIKDCLGKPESILVMEEHKR